MTSGSLNSGMFWGSANATACYKQDEFVKRINRALGVDLSGVSCTVVNPQAMTKVMRKAGWSANETAGVVGFQLDNNVYVLNSTPWTVLHELIHRAGVNADRLSRYVAEGLTEAIAIELKKGPDEHKPTYPEETRWVQQTLLPRLGMTAVQLGRKLAHSSDPPRVLAELMAKAKPGTMVAALERQLQPQKGGKPDFNRWGSASTRRGSVTRLPPRPATGSRNTGTIAALLLLAGAALGLPCVI